MEADMAELQQLLLDCLKKDEPVELTRIAALLPEEWQSLLALVAVQRIRSLFWHRLKQKGLARSVPAEVAHALQEAFQQITMRNLFHYGELRMLLTALNTEGIPLILLKGIYLADAVYESAGLREMRDIDVLARPTDLARIVTILADMGYTSPQPICPEITLQTHQHLPPMIKAGRATFEIHWNIVGPEESWFVDHEWLWQQSVPVQIAGCAALTLSPEALLLHLCLHTSYHHQFAFGLRPSCDIATVITRSGPALDWRAVADQAVCNGWQRGVYLALRLAQELVGAKIPDYVLERLRPADMTDTLLATVRSQVFGDKRIAASIPVRLAEFLESRSFIDKMRIFWQRVFVSRAVMASKYPAPVDSMRLYGYYPKRVFDLLRHHGHNLKKYHQNNAPLKGTVERANVIAAWLASPGEN